MFHIYNYIEAIGEGYPSVQVESLGDGSVYEGLVHVSGPPIPSKSELDLWILQKNRDQMWDCIKAERDRRKFAGVEINDVWFHSDDSSRIQYIGLLMMGASMPAGIQWKTLANDFVTMTPTLVSQIFQAISASDIAIFEIAEQKKLLMSLSSDPLSFDYTTGWPPIFGE